MRLKAQDDNSTRWYVINTNPRCEDLVYSILSNQSFEVFLPRIVKKSDKKTTDHLFPGYLFVRLDLNLPDWVRIKYLHGVRKIVSFGTIPIPVSEEIIASVKQKVKTSDCTGTELSFSAGDKVRFVKGPFEGLEGIFTGEVSSRERVKILLEAIHNWAFTVEARAVEISRAN